MAAEAERIRMATVETHEFDNHVSSYWNHDLKVVCFRVGSVHPSVSCLPFSAVTFPLAQTPTVKE